MNEAYIYAIQHNKTKKIYIGKAKNVFKRYEQHLLDLKLNQHPSKEMQDDYQKYGADFSVYILEKVENHKERVNYNGRDRSKGTIAEVKWMQEYETTTCGYNIQNVVAKRIIEKDSVNFPLKEGLPLKT